MALKSKEWFFKQCLEEARNYTPFAHLAWTLLDKGIGQEDATRGHVAQAIGATQQFLRHFAPHRTAIRTADRTVPFDLAAHGPILNDWIHWFQQERGRLQGSGGDHGRASFGYNIERLARILPPGFGGTRVGGGGGLDEFKRVLRLVPEFWDRT